MDYGVLWRIHAILMGTSFLSMTGGIVVSLFFRKKPWRYKTHRNLGIYAGGSGMTGLIIAAVMVEISSGYHLSSGHGILGAVTGILLILTPILGLSLKKVKNKKLVRKLHRLLGFVTLPLMAATIVLGLLLTGLIYF